jgi:hypothetical protein
MQPMCRKSVSPGRVNVMVLAASAVSLLLGGCGDSTAPAENGGGQPITPFAVTAASRAAALNATFRASHKFPVVSARTIPTGFSASSADPPVSSPFDLTYFGGHLLHAATSYNVYVNCADPIACWGTGRRSPATFLHDLNSDGFIQLMNEFIGTDALHHFPVAELSTTVDSFSTPNVASVNDILSIVLSAVITTGAFGYSAVYHVFLPQGTDMCFDANTCYSPDNFDTFVFCAFHSSVDFDENTHVLFTLEPYQFVPGCSIPGQAPHGVIDATASTLSHELMETMMDPDGDAWFNGLFGLEGSDMCAALGSNELIGFHEYFVQKEYSNEVHGCTTRD